MVLFLALFRTLEPELSRDRGSGRKKLPSSRYPRVTLCTVGMIPFFGAPEIGSDCNPSSRPVRSISRDEKFGKTTIHSASHHSSSAADSKPQPGREIPSPKIPPIVYSTTVSYPQAQLKWGKRQPGREKGKREKEKKRKKRKKKKNGE